MRGPIQLGATLGLCARIEQRPLALAGTAGARPGGHGTDVEQDGLALLGDAQHVVDDGLVDDAVSQDGGGGVGGGGGVLDGDEDGGAVAAGQLVGGLLVVQAGDQEQGVEPRGAAAEGGALGGGGEVGEGEEAGGGEGEARDGVRGPAGHQRGRVEEGRCGPGRGGHVLLGLERPPLTEERWDQGD